MQWVSVPLQKERSMPELPEVEVIKRGLEPHIIGKSIITVSSDGKRLRFSVPASAMKKALTGRKILAIKRRAKYLVLEFNSGSLLVIHLGMTGKLGLFPETSETLAHDHVIWRLDDGMEMRFNDVRRFGSIQIVPPDEKDNLEKLAIKNTGPEPFDPIFNETYLYQKAAGKIKPVKNFIMDNSVVAGIGNIYANESLFAAGIKPSRKIGSISKNKWSHLVLEIQKVLNWAIQCGGSTISDFLNASGEPGYFQANFTVYGKKDQPCPNCSAPIKKELIGGRASYYCSRCQR